MQCCFFRSSTSRLERHAVMAEQGPLSNQKLGEKYLLGELLGQGGFGVVYKAEHILLHRPQAIKILLEQYLNSLKFRERFTREAQTLAALDHPNIVHVDDFGIEGSRAYLVMPYIGGGTLHGLLRARQGPLGLDEIGRYLEQICAALYYAHARNVAHLDLKPANLLIQDDGRLVLSDFGLAHLMGEGAIEGGASLQFGTPAYMAPEHLRGLRDRRSDVYSLGVILYQMLVGHAPFEGSTPAAIMIKQLTEPPPPLREARPDLPKPLEDVLAKALEKQPEERYQTPGELFLDFKAALGGRLPQPMAWQFVPPAAPPRQSKPLPEPKRPFPIAIEPTPVTQAPATPTPAAPSAPAGMPSSLAETTPTRTTLPLPNHRHQRASPNPFQKRRHQRASLSRRFQRRRRQHRTRPIRGMTGRCPLCPIPALPISRRPCWSRPLSVPGLPEMHLMLAAFAAPARSPRRCCASPPGPISGRKASPACLLSAPSLVALAFLAR